MTDVHVTLVGYVGTDVDYREGNGAAPRAMFRVGSTPRFFDRQQGAWRDQETVWVTVKVWRSLAANVSSSVRKGEPVIVVGKLRTDAWKDEQGEIRRREVLEATSVGHDLTRGTSAYLRRPTTPVDRVDDSVDAEVHARLERESQTAPALEPVASSASSATSVQQPGAA